MAGGSKETTKKASPNDWAFACEHMQGDDDNGDGGFMRDTMLCFKKHGVLAWTLLASLTAESSVASAFSS